jgi:hypothetical protein
MLCVFLVIIGKLLYDRDVKANSFLEVVVTLMQPTSEVKKT